MPPEKSGSEGKQLVRKILTIEVKKEIIEKSEEGLRVTDLARQYGLNKSTIGTILSSKESLKKAQVSKGSSKMINISQRKPVMDKIFCSSGPKKGKWLETPSAENSSATKP